MFFTQTRLKAHAEKQLVRFVFLTWVFNGFSQHIEGLILDAHTDQPLSYVHVGVVGENVGCISKEDGSYRVETKNLEGESINFSMIGYQDTSFPVAVWQGSFLPVRLVPRAYGLNEIIVRPREASKVIKLGRFKKTRMTTGHGGVVDYAWGGEWALSMDSDQFPIQVRNINFHLRFNTVDSALFRINLYEMRNSMPGESLLNKEIFVKSYNGENWISRDMENLQVILNQPFVVSLELIRVWYSEKGGNHLFFSHGKNTKTIKKYGRASSYAPWKINGSPPIALYMEGMVLDQ